MIFMLVCFSVLFDCQGAALWFGGDFYCGKHVSFQCTSLKAMELKFIFSPKLQSSIRSHVTSSGCAMPVASRGPQVLLDGCFILV